MITKMDYFMLGVFAFSQVINALIQLYPNYIQYPVEWFWYFAIILFACYLTVLAYFGYKILHKKLEVKKNEM